MNTAHARRTDPDTSHAAAASVKPERLRAIVLDALRTHGPMDDTRLVNVIGYYTPSGIRTRRSELAASGHVVDTGLRVTLESGRKAIVWQAVERA